MTNGFAIAARFGRGRFDVMWECVISPGNRSRGARQISRVEPGKRAVVDMVASKQEIARIP